MMKTISAFVTILLISLSSYAQVPLGTEPIWQSSETGVFSTGMIWRDCNLDGWIDVFYSNGNDMALAANTLYMSDNGTLPLSATYSSTNTEYSGHCAVGDINGDGYPDWIVANYLGQGRFGTAGHGQGYFNLGGLPESSPSWQTDDSLYSFSCAMGDVDNDGDLDVVFATGEPYYLKYQPDLIYYNDHGTLLTTPGWHSHDSTGALDVTLGDVDNDGDLDIAFCYESVPTAVYFNQDGVIDTIPGWTSALTRSGNTLVFADVNGDDWLDLIVAYNAQLGTGGYFAAYINDGNGNLSVVPLWQSSSTGYGSALAVYDYDGDGDDDLAAGRWWDQARIYENSGSTFSSTPVWRAGLETVVEELAWVDVDRSGVEVYKELFAPFSPTINRRLFYTERHPLYSVDSVRVDGLTLPLDQFCYDLVSGWVSIGVDPDDSLEIFYQYSASNDLAVANWGEVNDLYPNVTPCCGRFVGGLTGNTDCDPEGKRNLADISRLIDRVYISKVELCCEANGNIDGDLDSNLNLADITRLIDHVYISKEETAACL